MCVYQVYGKGSQFLMFREAPATIWTRHSTAADGSELFADYYPTQVSSCSGGVIKEGLRIALESIKDHSSYNSTVVSGGATSSQMLRMA